MYNTNYRLHSDFIPSLKSQSKKIKCIQKEVNTNYKLAAHYILLKLIQIQHDLRLETVAKGISLLGMKLGLFNQCCFH